MQIVAAAPFAEIISVDLFGKRLAPGSGAAFIVLVAFLVSYLAIRTSARMTRSVAWWPGGVESGGVHYHHLVWGILLMLLCGFLAFAAPLAAPWWHLVAIGFGIGAGFTLDEFALWVRLEDVYWSEEGRSSFDAVVATVAFGLLVVIGTRPFGLDDPTSITVTAVSVDGHRRARPRLLRQGPRAARRDRDLRPARRPRPRPPPRPPELAVGEVPLQGREARARPPPLRRRPRRWPRRAAAWAT